MERRKAVSFPVWAILVALGGWVLGATPAPGAHFDNTVSDLASFCYDCHTLNANLADPDTSFIQAAHSTLPTMRSKNGGIAPPTFGCTFCHNDPTRTVNMKTAFGPFDSKVSQHPVDRTYSKDGNSNVTLGANTYSTIYMSNWDNSFATPANQIGCVACHDAGANGGAYPNHPIPGTGSRAAGVNPFMLRNTAAMDNNHAPDSFCLATCHAGTAPGSSAYRMGHYGWAAYDNTTGGMPPATLKEKDGTPLKTSKCTDCHETHSANVKPNLMGEQRQSAWNVGNNNSFYDPSVCTQCHSDTTFLAAGHGKTGISLNCGNCHSPSASHRDPSNPRRLSSIPAAPPADMLPMSASYGSNGRDDNYNGVIDEAAESSLLLSAESNCSATCHSDKHVHGGNIEGTSGTASCLHCHDPHGKGVDNNGMMVRRTVMEKETLYFTTTDLFRSDNSATRASICDNPNCHVKPLGSTSTPGTIMGDVQEHKDANVTYGTDCTGCHSHSSTTGGNSFLPVCNSCHTYPGQAVLGGTHVLSAVHTRHIAQDNVGGYGLACATCHYKYTHNQSGVNNAGEWATRFQSNNVNIKFAGTWNPKNLNGPLYNGVAADNTLADNVYAPGVGGTGTCAGLYCHGDSAAVSSWPGGTDTTPEWNNPSTAACGTCHRATASNPPQTFAHARHADNTTIGYAISCRKCHYQTTSDGLTVTSRPSHLNRQSQVSFDSADPLLSSGSYGGTTTVGDSGSTVGTCSNIYCHSPGNRTGPPFDNAALGQPDWKTAGPLACNACHGAPGQVSPRVGMPDYPNGSPKANSHGKHLDDQFACRVCHFATTTTDTTITDRSVHVNGAYDAVNDNVARHAFGYAASACSAAVCHGGWGSGPNMPVWGAGPYACDVCHMNTAGAAATSDSDQFAYDNGMAKINADQWNGAVNGSGHGRSSAYPSGNPGAGSRFASCTANCHTSAIGHDNSVNFFRLRTYAGIVDFSDTNRDPGAQQDDNLICLDCHSTTGANPVKATRLVDQNHYGTWNNNKHTASTMGGTFCVDCHDPHGDSNHYMVQDNVTKTSDGVYGIPTVQAPVARFTQQNLDGASGLDGVYDWGDYVKSTSPYTGICQTCHASSGGANYFNTGASGYTATHNKAGSPPSRCTACHLHSEDFSPSCTGCHGEPTAGNGSPPSAPFSGNRIWPATVDNASNLAGVGNHRSRPASGIDNSGHDPFMASTTGCTECHTGTPGAGSDHNVGTNVNATMTNIATHAWYNGAPASWSAGPLDGGVAGGSVVDDACSNINCHSPYYGAPANQYRSATPMPYTRYWTNQTLWDCYTCHAYDGRTPTSRPGGADNTMATGMHSAHVGSAQLACSNCHDVTGYATTSFAGNHKNGFVDWSFAGAPNPFGTSPAYSVASGSRAPTDDNTAAGHPSWGGCSNLYCHSTVQASPPSGGTGVTYTGPAWDNALTGQCGTCHAGDGVSGNLTLMATGTHGPHLASGYAIACTACHTGAGTGTTAHADMTIQVPMGDGSWRSYTLTAGTTIYDRAASPGTDNANAAPGAAYGRCSSIPCHSDGNGGAPRINPAIWGDTQAAATNCTYCHGGSASTGAAISTGSHTRHILDKGFACGKCHAGTVSTSSDNTITGYANHLDGQKTVQFSAEVGGTYDNAAKTCSSTYCHGTGPSPAWGSGPIAGCSVCHQNQGASTTGSFTGAHHAHTTYYKMRVACETCHAANTVNPGSHPNTVHVGGPDNVAAGKTAEVKYTDNSANQTYDNVAAVYLSRDLYANPYLGSAASPAYANAPTATGNDALNPAISWTKGSCSNVWCHSNANPVGFKGVSGTNQYRMPAWTDTCGDCHRPRPNDVDCTQCHAGKATAVQMTGTDNLSAAHITHVADDRYAFTCDECHAWTVPNDTDGTSGLGIIAGTGHDNHVNGIKTVRFGSTLRTTTIDQSGGVYDNALLRCANLYCHSNGTDNVAFGAPRDNTISWNSATGGTCITCHGGNSASGAPMATGSHTRHVANANLPCGKCHNATLSTAADNAITTYANHVNGVKNVQFSVEVGGTYDGATKTCSSTYCHGTGPSPAWGSGPIGGCSICHQSQGAGTGAASFTGPHARHVDNTAAQRYRFACDQCHATNGGQAVAVHAGGDDNTAGPATVEVRFTDNAFASWTYGGASWTYRSMNLWASPFGVTAPTPIYAGSGTQGGVDSVNGSITWSTGSCGTVWCHSNANPASAGGGTNSYRAASWTTGSPLTCTSCHLGPDTQANMLGASDRMSNGHVYHVSTDMYRYTCDECHADTAADNSTTSILDPSGFAFHVNGNKRDIRGSTTVKQSTTVNTALAYDNATRSCSGTNNYCHSNGQRQSPPFSARDNTFLWTWNAVPSYGCGSSNKCHASNLGPASTNFTTAGDNSAHTKHPYGCIACHFETQNSPYGTGIGDGLHANGVKDITISSQPPNIYDNDAIPTNNFDAPTKTCSGIACHGGAPVAWTDTLSCDSCHTKVGNVDVTADVDDFVFTTQTPNMSKIYLADYQNRGHGRNGALPWGSGKNPASLFGRAIVCLDCHDKAVAHNVSTNPFRFRATINGNAVTFDNVDTVCYACHASASVRDHAKAVTGGGASGWEHTQKCVDCHDAHGEANIFMVHDNIVWQTNGGATYATSDAYGIPYNPASRAPVVFSANAAGSDYASTDNAAPYDGICEVCHTRTAQYQRDTANGKAGSQGHLTDKCTTCHNHDSGFKGSGCSGCHGSGVTGQYWPAVTPGAYPNRAGAHGNHVDAVGAWLYGETAATGLLADTAKGTTDAKQKTVCSWCHPNPGSPRSGTGEPVHSDYVAPADVHGDGRAGAAATYLQYYDGNLAVPGSDNNTAAAYDNTTRSCSNTRCHNNVATPSGANDWRTPPAWSTTGCDSAQCHATPAASGGHYTHYAPDTASPPGMMYACSQCHAVPTSLRHGNGQVNLSFSGLEAARGGGDGFYDKDNSGTQTAGDNNFKAFDGVYTRSCRNIYCHGADNAWGGTGTAPAWDNASAGDCGTCHGAYGSPFDSGGGPHTPVVTGSHPVHFRQYDSGGLEVTTRGPRLTPHSGDLSGGCVPCHNINGAGSNCTNACHRTGQGANWPTGTHADGNIDFRNDIFVNPPGFTDPYTPATLAATPACNNCHSTATVITTAHPSPGTTGVAEAKGNWDNAAYRLDCLTCHNGIAPANSNSGGTGLAAPNLYGDGSSFGAEARGHNRTTATGPYPVTNNPAANRTCDSCHDLAISHIDGTDNTTFAGNRLLATVNGNPTGSTVSGLCAACHTTGGSSPASKKSINPHGNAGYAGNLENQPTSNPPSPGAFQAACNQCHEPHGMVNVTAAPAGVNLWMINPTITVTTGVTQSPVRLFAKSGANSFDNTGTASDLCRACHANASNPGFPMTYNVAGQHAAPAYSGDERGKDCSGCHSHNQDGSIATVDGLMPLACNACHSYPGVSGGTWTKAMSAVHGKHVGTPADTANSRQYECTVCHFNYSHNGNGLSAGQAWPGTYYNFVNIDFDPAVNPANANGPMYNGAATPTTGNGGTGACAGIYCHGNSASQSTWGGTTTATPPRWDNTVTASCGSCHRADATMPQGNHPAHLSAVYGPNSAAFTASGTCSEGTGCHTAYGFSPTTSHANGQPSFRTSPGDATPVGLGATQICRNCHTTYTSVNIPQSGDNLVRTRANWDDNTWFVDCLTCHNGTAAGTQATANLDGTGGVAAAIEGTIYTMQHGTMGIGCGWCHGDIGHIGANRPVGTNPYRLAGYYFTGSYPPVTQLGQIDFACNACHSVFSGYDHTWRVSGTGSSGPEAKAATDTHPTTVLSVGAGKDRWYQLPASTHMPLYGDLLDVNYNPSVGSNNYVLCVTCHDPHGVSTSPLPSSVRRFSGQNNDGKGNKALRFNYSGGTPTALCSQCHT